MRNLLSNVVTFLIVSLLPPPPQGIRLNSPLVKELTCLKSQLSYPGNFHIVLLFLHVQGPTRTVHPTFVAALVL